MLLVAVGVDAQSLSPLDFGWRKATTDIARYNVLYRTHTEAVRQNKSVSYKGIAVANIAIALDAKPIPLTPQTDFGGLVVNVTSCAKNAFVFSMIGTGRKHISGLKKSHIDKGDFRQYANLAKGDVMLLLQDQNAWGERQGSTEPIVRRDILLLHDGIAENSVVQPYDNNYSSPKCEYLKVDGVKRWVKNLTFNRGANLKYMAKPLDFQFLDNITVENVTLTTPQSSLTGDEAFRVFHCANVTFRNITVNSTYSSAKKYGYAFYMINVYNFVGYNIKAHAPWGVFGCMSINTALLESCDLNRWDIHYYGKNATLRTTVFRNLYNQYSSTYGTVLYDSCTFVNSIPYLMEPSYRSYVKHKVVFRDCTVNSTDSNASLFVMNPGLSLSSSRQELKKKYWPDVEITNLTVITHDGNGRQTSRTIKAKKYTNNSKITQSLKYIQ